MSGLFRFPRTKMLSSKPLNISKRPGMKAGKHEV